jgi:hypothetical protein
MFFSTQKFLTIVFKVIIIPSLGLRIISGQGDNRKCWRVRKQHFSVSLEIGWKCCQKMFFVQKSSTMYSGVPIKMSFLKSQRENFQDCQL